MYEKMREPIIKGLHEYINKYMFVDYETVKSWKRWVKPNRKYRQYIIEYMEQRNDDVIQYLGQDIFQKKFL